MNELQLEVRILGLGGLCVKGEQSFFPSPKLARLIGATRLSPTNY